MGTAEDTTQTPTKELENSKRPRPDGTDRDRYKNLMRWSYRKWAWEFLRRNVEFQQACKRVISGTEAEKQAVADKFGLKQFKSYREQYMGAAGNPKFAIGSISSRSNLDVNSGGKPLPQIKINVGQVGIRFDLDSALADTKALQKQLRMAETLLRRKLGEYEKLTGKGAREHKHKPGTFGIYIRLLDHKATGKSHVECARLIYPEDAKVLGNTELHQLVKDQMDAAKEYARIGYQYLSLWKGKPATVAIPLQRQELRG